MAKDNKFGTFGGVFTPSILTILGVIMYLRLPWVVGHAGLYGAFGIILVAHVISVCTGLSISSIATDKSVGAGGPYYIISRSLGLPIGGALGLALFLGLSFSISLYVIGFSESFLSYFGWEATPTNIRLCGTATLVALTIVTLISTALAIKTQYLIMGLIALSLVSIFGGHPSAVPAAPQLDPYPGGAPMATLFGIFFPAVTGFTAGVNMSGDLRDPKRAIPTGTMASIIVGAAVYFALAAFLAYRVPAEDLIERPDILLEIAWAPEAVVAGIWGATLSSALGSILGAPRILQALAGDHVAPRFFAKGTGPTHEPRNALIVAFAIGEAGILIAELDAIARIVSMVFLTTYGVLNLSAFIESWASPDFRPEFRVPKSVSLIGAITALVVMIQLDLPAMLGASLVMLGLFAYLQRRRLKLESGDTWEGLWAAVVRAGLHRLGMERGQQRNWRPNLLVFESPDDPHRDSMMELTRTLITGNGVATDVELVPAGKQGLAPRRGEVLDEATVGLFHLRVPAEDRWQTVVAASRFHGFTGMEPNTVLLDWYTLRDDPAQLVSLLQELHALDLNVLLYAPAPVGMGARARIDVWWNQAGGNLPLALALVRFMTADRSWHGAQVRILLVAEESGDAEPMRVSARRLVEEMRIEATLRIIDNSLHTRTYLDWIREESGDADFTITGLPPLDAEALTPLVPLVEALGTVLILRAADSFREVIRVGRTGTGSHPVLTLEDDPDEGLPPLDLPQTPDLAALVRDEAARWDARTRTLYQEGLARLYARDLDLLRDVRALLDKHFGMLAKGLTGSNLRRHRNVVNRVQSSFLHDSRELLDGAEDELLPEAYAVLEARIAQALRDDDLLPAGPAGWLRVRRPLSDFAPSPDDPPAVRRFKRRHRLWARLGGGSASMVVPASDLQRYYQECGHREVLLAALHQFETDSHQVAVQIGKILNSSKTSLTILLQQLAPDEPVAEFVGTQRDQALGRIDELIAASEGRMAQLRRDLRVRTLGLVQAFADDVVRVDVLHLSHEDRRLPPQWEEVRQQAETLPEHWRAGQVEILHRARLGLVLTTFHHRLAAAAHRLRERLDMAVRTGVRGECEQLLRLLDGLAEGLRDPAAPPPTFKPSLDLDAHFAPSEVLSALRSDLQGPLAELPESFDTVTDDSLHALEEGEPTELEPLTLAVRRLVEFLFETEFVAEIEGTLERLPALEQRAATTAQDVVRLISFHLTEYRELPDDEREGMRAQVLEVVQEGATRVRKDLAALHDAVPEIARVIDSRLQIVLEGTAPYELTRSSSRLEQHIRLHHSRKAVEDARGWMHRAHTRLREGVVELLYRRRAGHLFARTPRPELPPARNVVDRVRQATRGHQPDPKVLDALPFHYRQLFLGHSAPGEALWVGRAGELEQARLAIADFRRGAKGSLIVTGARGSGKSSLCHRITTELLDRRHVLRILPPSHDEPTVPALETALRAATGREGDVDAILRTLPESTTVLVDDLEQWWTRAPGGLDVIERLLRYVERHGDRILFVLAGSAPSLEIMGRLVPLFDGALSVITCPRMDVAEIERAISLRHGTTGLRYTLGTHTQDSLRPWTRVRLFATLFDRSGGNVGAALRAWVAAIDRLDGATLHLDPHAPDLLGALADLRVDLDALLVQFALHKHIGPERLARVTGLPREVLTRETETLLRMGLLDRARTGTYALDRYVQHIVVQHLKQRGMLP